MKRYRVLRLCNRCNKRKPLSDFVKHAASANGRRRICSSCWGKAQAVYRKKWRAKDPERFREHWRNTYQQRKIDALIHYSEGTVACACCGEDELIFLCIDHVKGGGNEHRKQVGLEIYRWLKTQGYPDGFQVLCWNCNWAKYTKGVCPHQISAEAQSQSER